METEIEDSLNSQERQRPGTYAGELVPVSFCYLCMYTLLFTSGSSACGPSPVAAPERELAARAVHVPAHLLPDRGEDALRSQDRLEGEHGPPRRRLQEEPAPR